MVLQYLVQAIYPDWIYNILYAIILFTAFSILYRDHPFYPIIEGCAIGTLCAQTLVYDLKSIQLTGIQPLSTGDLGGLAVIILGLLYFTIFIARFRDLYRLSAAVTFGTTLGTGLRSILGVVVASITTYTVWNTTESFLGAIAMVLALMYAIFWKSVDARLGRLKTIGLGAVFIYFGVGLGGDTVRAFSVLMGSFIDITTNIYGLAIMVIVFVIILGDLVYRTLVKRAPAPTRKSRPIPNIFFLVFIFNELAWRD